jgi:hypothetical protein
LEVLAHSTEIVADVESAGWLYAGKNSQIKLLQLKLRKYHTSLRQNNDIAGKCQVLHRLHLPPGFNEKPNFSGKGAGQARANAQIFEPKAQVFSQMR